MDYSAYTSSEARALVKDTHRTVGVQVTETPSLFSQIHRQSPTSFFLQLTTTNFLHQMARRLATDLILVAQGQLTLEKFREKFSSNVDPADEKQLLGINGLYLQNVLYDERDFQRYVTYTTLASKRNKLYPLATVFTGEE